jgi:hypothetical protein
MIQYSCDRCHRKIDAQEIRFSVGIQIQAALDPNEPEMDDDRDHLVELQGILNQMEDADYEEISQAAFHRCHYDLCSDCHRQFVKNPLATDTNANLEFSDN